ncbi:peroxisomal membrane protein 11B [Patella vulgata]|uniref:peroxisomal membrane protein 11B n=1 Tax=Patella vulgata TaxID=6465 RepID=UPI0021808335|nr:peroxisomal membrane protein 11B [Patella vulgata]
MATDFFSGVVKFNAQTSGRDKLCRLCQYGCKLVWWYIHQDGSRKDLAVKLKNLESSVSTTRKLLRFGKSVDFIQSALKSIHIDDTVWRLTITLSKINQACYLLFDHLIWAGRVGIMKVDSKKWSELSARFWLVSLILNLVRNFYDIYVILVREVKIQAARAKKSSSYVNGNSYDKDKPRKILTNNELACKCISENKPVWLDLIKNVCDIVLPLNSLGRIHVTPGTQGVVGVISSIVGIATTWDPLLRLVPS